MPKIKVNSLEMNYNEFGAGNKGTPILLLHGLGSQSKFMEPLANFLVKNCQSHVFTVDLPGFGYSDRHEDHPDTDQSYSIESFAKDVVGWLDAMGLKKVHFLGHSMGGMIAQLIAKEHADRIEKLILLATGTHLRVSSVEVGLAKILPLKATVKISFGRAFPTDAPAKIDEAVTASMQRTSRTAFVKGLAQITKKHFYSEPWLSQIKVPTLVIGSENDRQLGYDMSKLLAEKIPGAILYTIRGGCHEAQVMFTDEVGKAVVKFITA
nr:alpha/beta hydrolase [Candidatus Sigynarchaeota archaeon]